MGFKNYRIVIIVRTLALTATLLLLVWLYLNSTYYLTQIMILGLAGVQIYGLIRYLDRTNRELTRFLEAVKYSDFSQSFNYRRLGGSFEKLGRAFSRVIEDFREQRSKTEEQHRYLQTVVQHIGIGLISFDQDGEVELMNTAAKRIIDLPVLRNISALKEHYPEFYETLATLKSGNRSLVKLSKKGMVMQVAVSATIFKMRGQQFKLVSLQNISAELEEKEMEAWENITRVLTHEIMNSITPISSLSDTVRSLLESEVMRDGENKMARLSQTSLDDVQSALETIHRRSRGLMQFVQSYRDFTRVPEPQYEQVRVGDVLKRVENLMKGEAAGRNAQITTSFEPETLEISADPQLIEQVLINLIKNALRATEETDEPQIILRGEQRNNQTCIDVIDNGKGISEEALEKIFIPFYTTQQTKSRTRKGTGIGLSLSRQIMRQHNGSLTVDSSEGKTRFTLRF